MTIRSATGRASRKGLPTKRVMKEQWLSVKVGALVEYLRGSLWFGPTVAVVVAGVLGVVLPTLKPADGSWLASLAFQGGAEGAAGVLRAIATSVITVTTLVFTLTVLTLQLASQQFSPRLLRTFLREGRNHVVLGTFLATFTYSLVVLHAVRSDSNGGEEVPGLAVTVAFGLALVSMGALVAFIDHITRSVRIDALMKRVENDTRSVIDSAHPEACRPEGERSIPALSGCAVSVLADRSGFVSGIAPQSLERLAIRHDLILAVVPKVGERVVEGCPLVRAFSRGEKDSPPDAAAVAEEVNEAIEIDFERTMQQDVDYGLRQLVDVAVKALSPGVNDPTTAVHAIGHLASILCVLVRRDLSAIIRTDDEGVVRVVVGTRRLQDYLHLACAQIRLYGARDAVVATALLELLRDVGRCATTHDHLRAVHDEAVMVVSAADREISEARDMDAVRDAAALVESALAHGDDGGPRGSVDETRWAALGAHQ